MAACKIIADRPILYSPCREQRWQRREGRGADLAHDKRAMTYTDRGEQSRTVETWKRDGCRAK